MHSDSADALICAVLRGESSAWPERSPSDFAEALLQRSRYHGVEALLNERLVRLKGWPPSVLTASRRNALAVGMWDLRNQIVIQTLLDALAKVDVRPIVFKGTAMAYSLYPNPALRPRGDADLLILPLDRARARNTFKSIGFVRNTGISGKFISYQDSYTLIAPDRSAHSIDLHWKINNSQALSRLFSYQELLQRSVQLPRLCSGALSAGPVHAMLLACMHRSTHKQVPYYVDGVARYGGDRLVWLYDIHLLAEAFTDADWQDFLQMAQLKGLCATCLEGLDRASACFGAKYPERVSAMLTQPRNRERVAVYLDAGPLRQHWMDFCALEGLGEKFQFLRELAFPPAAYMRERYSGGRFDWAPWLYARRAIAGVVKWLSGGRRTP